MKKAKGFTLIEVLIALLIVSGASIALYHSWSGSQLAIKKARRYNTAALLLQKKIVEFELESKDKTFDEIKEKEEGKFEDYPEFTWEITTRPFTLPNILPKKDNQQEGDLTEQLVKMLSEFSEKAIREVLVTVIYKQGEAVQKYSLSTLFIDYKKELPLAF